MNAAPETGARSACACLNLRMAARALTQMYDAHLAASGLKATQFSILSAIGLAGPLPLSRLAALLVMDRTTLTRNLGPLERDGLIAVGRDRQDRRRREAELTAKGRARLGLAFPLWQEAQRRFLERFGRERWRELRATLGVVTAAAREG